MKPNYLFFLLLATSFIINCDEGIHRKLPPKETNMEPTKLIAKLEFETPALLGEGAFWNFRTQEFYWIDIEAKKLCIYSPSKKINRSFSMPSRIGTVVPQTDTTAVVALEDGIYLIHTIDGSLKELSTVEKELTINRFNDGKCDPNGNLWVGSMHLDQSEPMGSVYKISEKGKTTKMIDSVTISNGIVWTKDSKTLYYIDTPTGKIEAFDFDKTTATISNQRTVVEISPSLGFPDGMAIDVEDMLWVGLWNGNAVARFNPNTGQLIATIEVPAHNVTACAFGGENLDKLYITTASVDMTEEEKQAYPLAGSIFVADPGVKGVQSTFFKSSN